MTLALSESSDNGSDHEEQVQEDDAHNEEETFAPCSTSNHPNPLTTQDDVTEVSYVPATPRYQPSNIIADEHEVFVNPTVSPVTSKPSTDTVLNTPAYVPATPKWCPDEGICPPGRCKGTKTHTHTHTELTNMAMTSTNTTATTSLTRTELQQPTPFQTPPPSVTYSSSAPTPEHPPFTCLTPAGSVASPIQPPDLFKDDDKPRKSLAPPKPSALNDFSTLDKSLVQDWLGERAVLQVPNSTETLWSDDDGDNGGGGSHAGLANNRHARRGRGGQQDRRVGLRRALVRVLLHRVPALPRRARVASQTRQSANVALQAACDRTKTDDLSAGRLATAQSAYCRALKKMR